MATWRQLFNEERKGQSDDSEVVSVAPDNLDWDAEFDDGFGCEEGAPFCIWTEKRVYFPICYDGREWAGSASRQPDGEPLDHQGG